MPVVGYSIVLELVLMGSKIAKNIKIQIIIKSIFT